MTKNNTELADKVIKYNLQEDEIKAINLSQLWEEIGFKELPNYKISKLNANGDPRKSLIYKYCYKLVLETRGLIEEKNYKKYITAQFQILKNISDGKQHALITPNCLVGEKAWNRWMMWSNCYAKLEKKLKTKIIKEKPSEDRVKSELLNTKNFFDSLPDAPISNDQISYAVTSGIMAKWITSGRVSPYFVVLSKTIKDVVENQYDKYFRFDPIIYQESITENCKRYFDELFN